MLRQKAKYYGFTSLVNFVKHAQVVIEVFDVRHLLLRCGSPVMVHILNQSILQSIDYMHAHVGASGTMH